MRIGRYRKLPRWQFLNSFEDAPQPVNSLPRFLSHISSEACPRGAAGEQASVPPCPPPSCRTL